MKICIPYSVSGQFIESDYGQVVLQVAEMIRKIGYDPILVCIGDIEWWIDAGELKMGYSIIKLGDIYKDRFDLLIDVGAKCSPLLRKQLSLKSIGFLYNRVIFQEMQKFSYACTEIDTYFEELDEVLIWDLFLCESEKACAEAILGCPISRVPFFWSFQQIESCLSEFTINLHPIRGKFICLEKNAENTSSCILPLLTAKVFGQVEEVLVYDDSNLLENTYFKENILKHIDFQEKIVFLSNIYRIINSCQDGICIAHMRFVPLEFYLFWICWLELPLIHNSLYLRDIGYTEGYYSGNSIQEASSAITRSYSEVEEDFENVKRRQKFLRTQLVSKTSLDRALGGWQLALEKFVSSSKKDGIGKIRDFQERIYTLCSYANKDKELELVIQRVGLFTHSSLYTHKEEYSSKDEIDLLYQSKFYIIFHKLSDNKDTILKACLLGCIPIYIREEGDEEFWKWLSSQIPIIECKTIKQGLFLIQRLLESSEIRCTYQKALTIN